jgi:aqualysin 1
VSEGSEAESGVNAYVIDTDVALHPDLNVLSQAAYNAVGDGKDYDCNGHGTHVAGSMGEKDNNSYYAGVAPDVAVTGVKVLNCSGSGSTSGVIAGVDWVTNNATKPAIANMSLGGGTSQALDDAVRKSAASGILYSVAVGNEGKGSCNFSPARAARTKEADGTWNYDNGVISVGATNSSNRDPSWSNYGNCTEVYAPGVSISSTWLNNRTNTISGTSMAAPHVGGVGALYLSKHYTTSGLTMSAVEKTLKSNADKKKTKNNGGTAIKLIDAAVTGEAGY